MVDVPSPPEITEDQLIKCRETGNYCPVLFEWYKYLKFRTLEWVKSG